MTTTDVLFEEANGPLGSPYLYTKRSYNQVIRKRVNKGIAKSLYLLIVEFFCDILLPQGYPHSVSEDYLSYQIWDTIQAFASTIMSIFTTRAILEGIGVGNAQASALSATLTWIIKDGTSMIGRIMFTWIKGKRLDCYSKQWRLFADVLNDVAMLIELSVPFFAKSSLYILCLTTTMKSIVGVAGGATRASITQHQARKGNMAEIAAKDGSQETIVNLLASFVGIATLNLVDDQIQWPFIFLLITVHVYANYKAVKSLVFKNLNNNRFYLVLKNYLAINTVLSPAKINQKESVIIGFGSNIPQLCGFDIKLGESLRNITDRYDYEELKQIIRTYNDKNYLLVPDVIDRTIYVCFEKQELAQDVISAYFEAVLLALATSIYNNSVLDVYSKRQLHHTTPITRLNTFMNTFDKNYDEESNMPLGLLKALDEYTRKELVMFFTALQFNGWDVKSHAFEIGEWRTKWKIDKKSS